MSVPLNIMIGNGISLIAAIFIILSLWVNDSKLAYKYQIYNSLILVIASFFFESAVGVVVFSIIAVRLTFVYKDCFTFKWAVFFLILSEVVGLLVNTHGWIGVIPLIAIIQITICNYAYENIRWIKLSFIVNEAFYLVYFFFIYDYVSTFASVVTVVVGCISYIKLVNERKSGTLTVH